MTARGIALHYVLDKPRPAPSEPAERRRRPVACAYPTRESFHAAWIEMSRNDREFRESHL